MPGALGLLMKTVWRGLPPSWSVILSPIVNVPGWLPLFFTVTFHKAYTYWSASAGLPLLAPSSYQQLLGHVLGQVS